MAPGGVGRAARERGAAAGVLAAVVCGFGWVLVARAASSGTHAAIPVGALLVAWAVRLAARARSTDLRWIALGAASLFLVLGELLLYRHALLARLVAMHAAEGAHEPDVLGADEYSAMTASKYLHIELDLGWWAAVALAAVLVWRTLAPPPAVPAFVPGGAAAEGEAAGGAVADVPQAAPGEVQDGATPAPS